ncbi:hypothetical protein VTK73DRAFT_4780 [Phialemonium thermophilum]|uniref:Tag1 C-terminal domain-containing protein n=1 Tax=Phialemonium thermophilum TaxID=223376 RepID=A0ABR3XYK4_9PEZI
MSSSERTPLLTADEPPGKASMLTPESLQESTPLLSTSDSTLQYDGRQGNFEDSDAVSQEEQREELRVVTPSPSISGTGQISADSRAGKEGRRWPSIIAIFFLTLLSIILIIVAFIAPAAVEEYAKQAVVLEPTNLSLESITSDGVQARVQAKFKLDASRVQKDNVRRVGRAATWVLRRLGTGPTNVTISVPEYDHVIVGSVSLPPLIVDIVDGHTTTVDFVAELIPGDADGIRAIANQWLEGRLDLLKLRGFADIRLQSGIVPLGTHRVSETLVFEAKELPAVPEYNITRLNFHEALGPDGDSRGMAAEVSLEAFNKYPVSLDVPELAFEILVPGCSLSDAYIIVSEAITKTVAVRPRSSVVVEVNALIRSLPDQLTRTCPDSSSSPLDLLLKQYLGGEEATVFVRGASHLGGDVPGWVVDILSSITVPAPFPGRSFDSLIRNFSLTDVSFTLPNPMADPHDPDASPKVSGVIEVLAVLPSEMNFNITVNKVRANADVFHEAKKLGELNLRRWQRAQSSKVVSEDGKNTLQIRSSIKDAPLDITDADVLTDVIESLLSGDDRVVLDINAKVDVKVQTVLGPLVLKDVPADGKVPLKRPSLFL